MGLDGTDHGREDFKMKITYPLFIQAKDDLSIIMINKVKELYQFEREDIKNGMYRGWDLQGFPLILTSDNKNDVQIKIIKETKEYGNLIKVLVEYAKTYSNYYRPNTPFSFEGLEDNPVRLMEAVTKHIKGRKFKYKVINFIKHLN